jgi:nicotinate-nucleotide adenylyltransferase
MVKRIGIFGGSFNPIHTAHLIIAELAREELFLDKVIFVPTNITPLKPKSSVIDPRHRLNMVKLAIRGNRAFGISDIEIRRGGISYTIDTISYFKKRFPNAEIFLIMGMDSLRDFKKWKDVQRLRKLCKIAVAGRVGSKRFLKSYTKRLSTPLLEISSSWIRSRIRRRLSIGYLLPPAVEKYIKREGLYRG